MSEQSKTDQDFLAVNTENTIKTHVRNIDDSYSNPWDILAELAQNAVDAIREWDALYDEEDRDHEINIQVDQTDRSIVFEDTGIGITPDNAPELLGPDATNKRNSKKTIGEKGVGLTFCIFCSNHFEIETTSENGRYEGKIQSARTWRESDSIQDRPTIQDVDIDDGSFQPEQTGTKIQLRDIQVSDDGKDIFSLSLQRLVYLLRTKTAIGNTKNIHTDTEPEIDVNLEYKNDEGEKLEEGIEYRYWYPEEFWSEDDVVDLNEFSSQDNIDKLTDDEKRDQLENKVWKVSGEAQRGSRTIRYYGFWVRSKNTWEKVAVQNEIYEEVGEDEVLSDLGPGIYVATRGMPTGVTIDRPDTGSAGYWDQIYLILGYDGFSWDYGRKSVPGPTQSMLKKVATEQFNEFTYWQRFMGKTSSSGDGPGPSSKPAQISRMQREDKFRDIEGIPNLDVDEISFEKSPDKQEAGVVGIFHELIGAGILSNYKCYRAGYKQDYDFWGRYTADVDELGSSISDHIDRDRIDQRIVVEFKYDCSDIIKDVEDNTKHFNEIDLLVCWKIERDDFQGTGLTVKSVDDSERYYVGSNYKIVPNGNSKMNDDEKYVISLSDLIDDLEL